MEIGVFQRKTEEPVQKQKLRIFDIIGRVNFVKIAYFCIVALVARPAIFGGLMPFGIAMYAAEYVDKLPYLTGVLVIAATILPKFAPLLTIKYTAALILFTAVAIKTEKISLKTPIRRGIIMGAVVFFSGFLMIIGNEVLLYDVFMLALESVITFVSVYLFCGAKKAILTGKSRTSLSGEDIINVAALVGIAVMGAGNLFTLFGINISGCLCILAVLIFAYNNGAAASAVAGITIGLIAGLTGSNTESVIGAFAFSALVSGFFSKYGKIGTAVSFVLANSVITFYTNGSTEALINLYEILIASVVFFAIPNRLLGRLSMDVAKKKNYTAQMKELIKNDLSQVSDSFDNLAKTFRKIAENKIYSTNTAAASFFEKTARRACEGCSFSVHCWKKEFHRTYTSFFVMLEVCEKHGGVTDADIPKSLVDKCPRINKLVDIFNNMYEVYKVDKLWESRVSEARGVVSKQLESVSRLMERMSKDVQRGASFDSAAEDNVTALLNENNIFVKDVVAINGKKGGMRLDVKLKDGIKPEVLKLTDMVSKATGEDMVLISESKDLSYRFGAASKYHVTLGTATIPKDHSVQNGDSFDHVYLENGGLMLAVSDGMGSGERACIDSSATVNLLKNLISTGFDLDTAIGLVNSVLVLKSAEASFATIDLAMFDLLRSEVEFIKIGAASSFVKKGEEVKIIHSRTLPAGVFEQLDMEKVKVKIGDGDIIVMMSDGVYDADRRAEGEMWLMETISDYEGTNPKELAEKILKTAKDRSAGIINDDMTVVVAYIKEANCESLAS